MKFISVLVGVGVLGSSGCTRHNPQACDANLVCANPAEPFCDLDGALDGIPGKCVAVACTPGRFEACRGDDVALTCSASGDDYDFVDCPFGCDASGGCKPCVEGELACDGGNVIRCTATGATEVDTTCDAGCIDGQTPRCSYLEPKFLPNICDAVATDDALTITTNTTIDTALEGACTQLVLQQGAAPVCVLRYKSISIAAGATLTVTWTALDPTVTTGPSLALVADEALDVAGTIDVSAKRDKSGPGGGFEVSGVSMLGRSGRGGAGFATDGGNGGSESGNGLGLAGGAAQPSPDTRTILFGGSRTVSAWGGGALDLIACRGRVTVSGTLVASGGGGGGGTVYFNLPASLTLNGGGGGGAGGVILLEGLGVSLTGKVFANGGAGGSGAVGGAVTATHSDSGKPGQDGLASLFAAPGGVPTEGAGLGGNGGVVSADAAAGFAANDTSRGSGGGGGSVGFVLVYGPANNVMTTPFAASPVPSTHVSRTK